MVENIYGSFVPKAEARFEKAAKDLVKKTQQAQKAQKLVKTTQQAQQAVSDVYFGQYPQGLAKAKREGIFKKNILFKVARGPGNNQLPQHQANSANEEEEDLIGVISQSFVKDDSESGDSSEE